MAKGQDAVNRLQEIENNKGMSGAPRQAQAIEVGETRSREAQGNTSAEALIAGALTDDDINANKLSQAERMEADAKSMLAEAKRLKAEAGVTKGTRRVGTKTTKAKKKQTA